MTQRKPAPKRKPTPKRRKRGLPIQVYVSPEERADLRAIARTRGVTVSKLVRDWIRRSAAAALGAVRKGCPEDPRQMPLILACLRCGELLDGPDSNWCPACAYGIEQCDGTEQCDGDGCPLAHVGVHDACCSNGDARQLRIGDASFTVLKEATADSQFVVIGVQPCCDSPLLHVGIHDGGCRVGDASSRWPATKPSPRQEAEV